MNNVKMTEFFVIQLKYKFIADDYFNVDVNQIFNLI